MFDVREDPAMVQRALLVGVEYGKVISDETISLVEELEELVNNIGVEVIEKTVIRVRKSNPKYLIGAGQAEEVMQLARAHRCDVIVFDDELSPAQQRNWERDIRKTLVIDRQEIIIDIFAQRAQTKEAKLQVDLARMEYSLPRLRRAWTHLGRQRGGGGVTQRGEGETQLEIDQRLVRNRIAKLKRELEVVIKQRKVQRHKRTRIPLPTAALIGYTNAGKSSLLNHLTDSHVIEEDKVFATLDPTSRRLELPNGQVMILTDTVGFVRKLPHRLVDAFKATLEEAVVSDLLIHVVDISQHDLEPYIETTLSVIEELQATDVKRLLVFNKVDLVDTESDRIRAIRQNYPEALFTSTQTGEGLFELQQVLEEIVSAQSSPRELLLPHNRYDILNQLHKVGAVTREQAIAEGIYVSGNIPARLMDQVSPFELNGKTKAIRNQLNEFV